MTRNTDPSPARQGAAMSQAASNRYEVGLELRDGLLQDLLAVSMLVSAERLRVRSAAAKARLSEVGATLDADIASVRLLIDELLAKTPQSLEPATPAFELPEDARTDLHEAAAWLRDEISRAS